MCTTARYNAIIYHHYQILPDLSLNHVLALETRLIDLYTAHEGGVIHRSVERISPNELLLSVVLKRERTVPVPEQLAGPPLENERTIPAPEKLGEVKLRRASPQAPYQVVTRRVFNQKYRGLLVSAFGEEADNRMLADGYRGYY